VRFQAVVAEQRVGFEWNSAEFDPLQAANTLTRLATALVQNRQLKLWVVGHRADGEEDELELERAEGVLHALCTLPPIHIPNPNHVYGACFVSHAVVARKRVMPSTSHMGCTNPNHDLNPNPNPNPDLHPNPYSNLIVKRHPAQHLQGKGAHLHCPRHCC
jgi:hypothetical protein